MDLRAISYIALLLVDDPLPLHQAVHDLRLRLNKSESYEFKFMRTHHDGRIAFFQAIKSFTFQVYALVVDKMNLESPTQWTKESLYNSLVKMALQYLGAINGATLVIDESFKGKAPKATLATYLRHQLNANRSAATRRIDKVVYHRSHQDNLLQVADMVAGAVARAYEGGDDQYRHLLGKKIVNVWVFPQRA